MTCVPVIRNLSNGSILARLPESNLEVSGLDREWVIAHLARQWAQTLPVLWDGKTNYHVNGKIAYGMGPTEAAARAHFVQQILQIWKLQGI